MKSKCDKCVYYHKENNTCQSKKCGTGGNGLVTIFDKIFCKPYTKEQEKSNSVVFNHVLSDGEC